MEKKKRVWALEGSSWVQVPALLIISSVTLGKLLNLPVPQSTQL